MSKTPDKLDQLEAQSVYILREAYREFKSLVMLWSIGKDSTVLLWLARKAFFGHVPFPLVHIDTSYKIPEMIKYRDELALKFNLNMVVGQNVQALKDKKTYPDGALDRISCCKALKTDALKNTLNLIPVSSSVPVPMRKEAVRRKGISLPATATATGMSATSRRNCGTSLRPISRPARTSAFIRSSTGRN